jgi:biopolymer transport protein ExbB
MHSLDMIVNFFRQGGVFLYPIALVWAIGLVIATERFIYLTKIGSGNRRFWDDLLPLFEQGNFRQALSIASSSDTALAQVMRYGMSRIQTARRRDDIEKAMEESLVEIIPRLEKRTHYLATLANIGMLMGLLGTVVGLINAFAAVATANPAEKASLLAASISVAMNNTALGLIAAITLLLSHMYLETQTTTLVDSLEVATVKFLNALAEKKMAPEDRVAAAAAAAAPGRAPDPRGARA